MNVLILAAGYGTRLQRGIEQDSTGLYKNLLGLPKALLPIGDCALISHWIKILNPLENVAKIIILSNERFFAKFESWYQNQEEKEKLILLNDGTTDNETRLGAIGSIEFAIEKSDVSDKPLLVVGGDTLLYNDFCVEKFISHGIGSGSDVFVTAYTVGDNETTKYGILEVENGFVINFREKPKSTETASRLACPCFYLFKPNVFGEITKFLESKKESPLSERDATGLMLKYLYPKIKMEAKPITGRYDVGNLEQYIECNNSFLAKKMKK